MRFEQHPRTHVTPSTLITSAGEGVTGLIPTVRIKRVVDGLYWNFDTGTGTGSWDVEPDTLVDMVEVDSEFQPGLYRYTLPGTAVDAELGARGYDVTITETTTDLIEQVTITVLEDPIGAPLDGLAYPMYSSESLDYSVPSADGGEVSFTLSVGTEPAVHGLVGVFTVTSASMTVASTVNDLFGAGKIRPAQFIETGVRVVGSTTTNVTATPTWASGSGPDGEDALTLAVTDATVFTVGQFVRVVSKAGGGTVYKVLYATGTTLRLHSPNTVYDVVNGDTMEAVKPTGQYHCRVDANIGGFVDFDTKYAFMNLSATVKTTGDVPKMEREVGLGWFRLVEVRVGQTAFRVG